MHHQILGVHFVVKLVITLLRDYCCCFVNKFFDVATTAFVLNGIKGLPHVQNWVVIFQIEVCFHKVDVVFQHGQNHGKQVHTNALVAIFVYNTNNCQIQNFGVFDCLEQTD